MEGKRPKRLKTALFTDIPVKKGLEILRFICYTVTMTVRMDESKCIYFKEEDTKMSVQVENLEKNMAKLTIEVSAEEL